MKIFWIIIIALVVVIAGVTIYHFASKPKAASGTAKKLQQAAFVRYGTVGTKEEGYWLDKNGNWWRAL